MNKKLELVLEQAQEYELGAPLDSIYIYSTNKLYNGFWGKNGYNGIVIIGTYKDKYYVVNKDYQCDVMDFRYLEDLAARMMLDIPHESNAIHMWFGKPICFKELLSSMMPQAYKGEDANE